MAEAPRLKQLNVSYVDVEDRIMLKVSTSDDKEYRAWCTRRFTRILMERLESMFEEEVDEAQVVPEETRKEVARIKHGDKVSEPSFQQPYEAEPTEYPLGEQGVLLTTLRYNRLESGMLALNLSDSDGRGVTLNLDQNLRHQLYELFQRGAERASWFDNAAPAAKPVVH